MNNPHPTSPQAPAHPPVPTHRPATAPTTPPNTAPSSSPGSSPAPAKAPEPVLVHQWNYPFELSSGKPVVDPQTFLATLSKAVDGFYPLGANGLIHPGIHFGGETASQLKQGDGIRNLADGEVVAYRLNKSYPQLDYPDGKKALYSTGFVLIRHKLALPPAPQTGASGANGNGAGSAKPANSAAATPPADEILTFYSVHMHLLDFAGYQAAEQEAENQAAAASKAGKKEVPKATIQRPAYWQGKRCFRVGAKATNQQARPALSPADQSAANDPLGALIHSLDQADADQQKALDHLKDLSDAASQPALDGINVRATPKGSQKLGILPRGSIITLGIPDPIKKDWAPITSIEQGTPVGLVVGQPPGAGVEKGWVYMPELDSLIEPETFDSVVVLDPPHKVNAGEVIGHLGEYTRYREANALPPKPKRPLVHMEVFAGSDFPAFLAKSRARAAQLPDSEKTVLVISKGAMLVPDDPAPDQTFPAGTKFKETSDSPKSGCWMKAQALQDQPAHGKQKAKSVPTGDALWVERVPFNPSQPLPAWKTFPLKLANAKTGPVGFQLAQSRSALEQLPPIRKAVDDQGTHWWCVLAGKEGEGSIRAWVCEKNHPQTTWQSPYAWPGFETVDASSLSIVESFKRFLYVTGSAQADEAPKFKPSASSMGSSELVTKVEEAVDYQGNKDGYVTAAELSSAMGVPWLAQALSRLIVKTESEWGGGMSKWSALTSLMGKLAPVWQAEMQRIEKLQWWDQAKGVKDFPANPVVHFINPIGLIGNFICGCNCINVEFFLENYASEHQSFDNANTPPLDETSKGHLRQLIEGIINYYKTYEDGKCNIPYMAYMLGTARWETKKAHKIDGKKVIIYFQPTTEGGDTDYFNRYDPVLADTEKRRKTAIANGNTQQGDGYKYRGRGYVQLTWKNNYKKVGDRVGKDLVSDPDLALEPDIAAVAVVYGMETGLFTGRKLSDYISDSSQDYYNARQIINGHDQADIIAEYARRFKEILEKSKC